MDENLFHYHLSNTDYQELLRQAQHTRLVACINRLRRAQEGVYPRWLAALLARLSQLLIAAGSRLQAELSKTGSLPSQPADLPHQYSYGD